jgi:hypothetical protein
MEHAEGVVVVALQHFDERRVGRHLLGQNLAVAVFVFEKHDGVAQVVGQFVLEAHRVAWYGIRLSLSVYR